MGMYTARHMQQGREKQKADVHYRQCVIVLLLLPFHGRVHGPLVQVTSVPSAMFMRRTSALHPSRAMGHSGCVQYQ